MFFYFILFYVFCFQDSAQGRWISKGEATRTMESVLVPTWGSPFFKLMECPVINEMSRFLYLPQEPRDGQLALQDGQLSLQDGQLSLQDGQLAQELQDGQLAQEHQDGQLALEDGELAPISPLFDGRSSSSTVVNVESRGLTTDDLPVPIPVVPNDPDDVPDEWAVLHFV